MKTPRVLVIRTAGINCDLETARALELAGALPERVHVRAFLDGGRRLDEFGAIVFPGGFSHGDDLGSGTVLANQLTTKLGDALAAFVGAGRPVIGICNGFQVLVRLGVLPGLEDGRADGGKRASLVENESGKFEDRWIRLRVETDRCPFLAKGAVMEMPIAHKEGRFLARDERVLDDLEARGQVAVRYVDARGETAREYPANPNGSARAIAGVINEAGNVLGLMPHPERHVRFLHHPAWTRRAAESGIPADEERAGDGFAVFEALVRSIGRD
jgi:phosphoribosylformylglycinamidine synthase subunit PurQ / glutaminase